MKINNFWQEKKVSAELVYHMEMQRDALAHFKILETDHSILNDMERIEFLKRFKDILIFGIGGSSLGGQMLNEFRDENGPTLHFIDNIDAQTFNKKMDLLDPTTTGVISISKSGNTAETLTQTLLAKQRFETVLNNTWSNHFVVLTENKNSALRVFADHYNIETFDHDVNIGGRFCIFTNVGAIVASLIGMDFIKFRQGARDLLKRPMEELLQGATHMVDLNKEKGVNQSVMLVYADCLELYSDWYAQLWGESLGKRKGNDHIGITPISALGAVDQHSQLQLYLDGPRDKMISFITVKDHPKTDVIKKLDFDHDALNSLIGIDMTKLYIAEQEGTLETIKSRGCHVRQFELHQATPYYLGQLVMYQMVETIATAFLFGIDPFDQPAVEESKVRAMDYLKNNR